MSSKRAHIFVANKAYHLVGSFSPNDFNNTIFELDHTSIQKDVLLGWFSSFLR